MPIGMNIVAQAVVNICGVGTGWEIGHPSLMTFENLTRFHGRNDARQSDEQNRQKRNLQHDPHVR
jgi:hypothetical protein